MLPPEGYYRRPTAIRKIRDVDTYELDLPGLKRVTLRLSGVNGDEVSTDTGIAAKHFVESYVAEEVRLDELMVYLEPAKDRDGDGEIDFTEVLKAATFDRWPGTIFVRGIDIRLHLLAREMVKLVPKYRNEHNAYLWEEAA